MKKRYIYLILLFTLLSTVLFSATRDSVYERFLSDGGSVSKPSHSFKLDQDNGLYYVSTDKWNLGVGGLQSIQLALSSGNYPNLGLCGQNASSLNGVVVYCKRDQNDINLFRVDNANTGSAAGAAFQFNGNGFNTYVGSSSSSNTNTSLAGRGYIWNLTGNGIGLIAAGGGSIGFWVGSVGNSSQVGDVDTNGLNIFFNKELRLQDTTGGEYIGFKSPSAVSASTTFTLPDGDGSSGELLSTNGSGTLSWTPASASTLPTGSVITYIGTTAPSTWVLLDGRTIGNAASGATNRANADTEDLFTLFWDSMSDTDAPVSSGRGASAAADFAANKTITISDGRGRAIAGKDDMGGSTASRITSAGSGITGTTLGTSGGSETHTVTTGEMPSHSHSGTGANNFVYSSNSGIGAVASGTGGATWGASGSTASAGSGNAHNNTQPTLILNYIIKL